MERYTYELATEFNFPNISIFRKLENGVHYAWRAQANAGYVMYNPNSTEVEWDEELEQEIPVTYYYRTKDLPLAFNFNNFPWLAAREIDVDADYIFGVNKNDYVTT